MAEHGTTRGATRARLPPGLLVPAVLVAALALLPLAYLAVRSTADGAAGFAILGEARTWAQIGRTALLVVLVTASAVLVGGVLAWLHVRSDLPGRRVWAALAVVPLVIPSYVLALALLAAVGPGGLFRELPGGDALPDVLGLPGAWLALTLATYPYVYLLAAAALRSIDPALEEAARALGRSPWAAFARTTLPALRPALGGGGLLVALYALSDFGVVALLRYDVLTRAIFVQYRALYDRTPAAVLALVLVALTGAALLLEGRLRGRARVTRSGPGAQRRQQAVALGAWRWPALAASGLVAAVAIVLPVGVLTWWLVRAARTDVDLAASIRPALGSVGLGLAAAAAAIACALPVAALAARHPGSVPRLLERATYASNALPGVVIGLALVFFGARYASPIYQTVWLLLVAYVVRFLPQAVAAAHAALARVDPRLEEAARSLGRSPRRAFLDVTAPLVARGLSAGAALVLLSTMKELPATILLRPAGFDTLATEIWTATRVAAYAEAAPPALLLLVLAAPLAWLLSARPSAVADDRHE